MSFIDFSSLRGVIEDYGVINVDEYIEEVQNAKRVLEQQNNELQAVVRTTLTKIRDMGDEEYLSTVATEYRAVAEQLNSTDEDLDAMEKQLNEMKEQTASNDFQANIEQLEEFESNIKGILTNLNNVFEDAPQSVKAVNRFNE